MFGPITAHGPSGPIALPRAKERALLAALALCHGRVVSKDRLVDALWADWPPVGAEKVLRTHVHRLRSALGEGVIETRSDGYALVPGVIIDTEVFEIEASAGDSAQDLRAAWSAGRASRTRTWASGHLPSWNARGWPSCATGRSRPVWPSRSRPGAHRAASPSSRLWWPRPPCASADGSS